MKKIVIGSEVTSIGNGAFLNAATTEVRIPKNSKLTRIGEYAFSFNVHSTKFTIPSKVKIIANGAFGCCLALQRIDIPSSVTSIGSGAFEGCSALNTLMIGKKLGILATEHSSPVSNWIKSSLRRKG